jgi:hypothetical protein
VRRVADNGTVEGAVGLTFPSGTLIREAFRAPWRPILPGRSARSDGHTAGRRGADDAWRASRVARPERARPPRT